MSVNCEFRFDIYPAILKDKIKTNVKSRGAESIQDLDVISQIGLVAQAFIATGKTFSKDVKLYRKEKNTKAGEEAVIEITRNKDNQIIFPDGSSLEDLNRRTHDLTPHLYDARTAAANKIVIEAVKLGATFLAVPYFREGKDNSDIVVMEIDNKTNKGVERVITASSDGNSHFFSDIKNIVAKKFPGLNLNISTENVFVVSNVEIPPEKINGIMREFGLSEGVFNKKELQIHETQMRFDEKSGKVFSKGRNNKETDLEIQVCTDDERKQKHRLVGRIKTCFECSVKTNKKEAFFWANENSISQVITDKDGNIIFKTIDLAKKMSFSDMKLLLLKLGYAGKNATREFSYRDDPLTDEKMKEIVKKGLADINERNRYKFLSLRVLPIENRFDFLRNDFKTDRIITNNPFLYFHDIALKRGVEKIEDKPKKKEQAPLFLDKNQYLARTSLSALVVLTEGAYGIDRVVRNSVDEAVERNVFEEKNKEGFLILNQAVDLPSAIRRKKSRFNGNAGGGNDDNDDSPAPSTHIHVDQKNDEPSRKYMGQKNGNPDPKNPKPQSPTKMFFEEENLTQEYFFAESSLVNSPLFQEDDQERHLEREEILTRQVDVEPEIVAKKTERTVEILTKKKNSFQYHDLDHDTERAQNIVANIKQLNMESNDLRKLIFPVITRSLPIGERVEMEKQQQEQMEQIWGMFLNLYFGVFFTQMKKGNDFEIKNRKKFVAKQEVRNPVKFFSQTQFMPYMRIFAIFLICILKLSAGI